VSRASKRDSAIARSVLEDRAAEQGRRDAQNQIREDARVALEAARLAKAAEAAEWTRAELQARVSGPCSQLDFTYHLTSDRVCRHWWVFLLYPLCVWMTLETFKSFDVTGSWRVAVCTLGFWFVGLASIDNLLITEGISGPWVIFLYIANWRWLVGKGIEWDYDEIHVVTHTPPTLIDGHMEDMRTDSHQVGELKHPQALQGWVEMSLSFAGVITHVTRKLISFELLAQLTTAQLMDPTVDVEIACERIAKAARSIVTVGIDRFSAINGNFVAQDTLIVAQGMFRSYREKLDEGGFHRPPA